MNLDSGEKTHRGVNKVYKRIKTVLGSTTVLFAVTVVLLILAVADALGAVDLSPFSGALLFAAAVTVSIMLLGQFSFGLSGRTVRFLKKLIVIAAILEIFVFNFNSFHLLFGNYERQTLDISSANVVNFNTKTWQNMSNGNASLEFVSLDVPIGTLTVNAYSDRNASVNINIDFTDDTYSARYRTGEANISPIRNDERSRTVPCNFSGDVHKLKLLFSASDGEKITVKSIEINRPIDFSFSPVRFFLIIFLSVAVYILTVSAKLKKSFSESEKTVSRVAYAFTAVLIAVALALTNAGRYKDYDHSIMKDFTLTTGNQMTKELVDAFEDGHTYLNIEPSDKLMALENPYDRSQRDEEQIGAHPWDHLLYNGKIYSYYGIAPVVLLFLPYHLLTGYYFPSFWAVWLFGCIGIFFLTKLYLLFMRKFFKDIRSSIVLMGLFMMQFISGVWFDFHISKFYEIAQTSGFACVAAGAYFMLKSNVIGGGEVSKLNAALSSVFLSLAVLCRPTLAVYCLAALIFIGAGVLKLRDNKSADKSAAKTYLPYLLCALLPFILIGSVQMLYNYMRFGSVFDFGIQYSLTVNDFIRAEYHTHFVLIGLFNYLFAIPRSSSTFPFLSFYSVEQFNPQGYYFIAVASALGILWKALPMFAYAKGAKAYSLCDRKNRRLYTAMLTAVCVIAPFIIMCSVWESGYTPRYGLDFNWQMLMGALIIAFVIYRRCKENTKRHLNTLMTVSLVICLILCFAQTYNFVIDSLPVDIKAQALSFGRLFEFLR